ncbi:MAG: divalent metal cation transporter [Bacteroidales bacterium]
MIVKVLHCEKEVEIPVETDIPPFYHWKDFRAYCKGEALSNLSIKHQQPHNVSTPQAHHIQDRPQSLVTAAFIGPGTITTCTLAGASFGYALLWGMVFSVAATIILQEMAARLGIISRNGLGEALRAHFSKPGKDPHSNPRSRRHYNRQCRLPDRQPAGCLNGTRDPLQPCATFNRRAGSQGSSGSSRGSSTCQFFHFFSSEYSPSVSGWPSTPS